MKWIAWRFEQMPIETLRKIPFFPLSKFSSHKKELFPWMPPHISKECTQVRETLPEITRHLINQGSLYMYDFVVRKWQNKVFGVGIHQRERDVVVVISSMNRVHVHGVQHSMH